MIIQSKTIFQNSDELRVEKITVIFGSIQTVMTLCRLSFGDQALVKFEPWSDGVLGTTNTHNYAQVYTVRVKKNFTFKFFWENFSNDSELLTKFIGWSDVTESMVTIR